MGKRRKRKKRSRKLGIAILLLAFLGAFAGFAYWEYYQRIFAPNVDLGEKKTSYFHIPTGSSIDRVVSLLEHKGVIKDGKSFRWLADKKNYANHVHPGRYLIQNGMSNNELVNLLRSGVQSPVKVTFNYLRTKEELAAKCSSYLELDSLDLISVLENDSVIRHYGFNRYTIVTLFLPNTYEFYWNTSAKGVLEKMAMAYRNFWTDERKAKARAINLSQSEVSILASIVQAEQLTHPDERPKVAGVYINRLKRGMKLESDPTLIFALGDFEIRRVLNIHKKIKSPYNTYLHRGLPPGPINIPEINAIEAVLDYERHNAIFMCAKDDFSGYHYFSETLAQHNKYARRYRRELNRRKIMK